MRLYMLRTVIWYSHFAGSLVAKTFQMHKVKSMEKNKSIEEKRQYVHEVTSKWAMSHIKTSGARVRVHGEENIPKDEPVVFISNHQGNFDIALFMAYIDKPKGYIAKAEMLKVPLIRTWMNYMECVFMDRSNIRKSAKAIIEGVKILKSGQSLVIFPEGTRSRGDKMGEFKAGSFKLATKAKVPIVPVTIKGSYKLMEGNKNRVKPADVDVFIHPPVKTDGLSKVELDALPKDIESIIAQKLL